MVPHCIITESSVQKHAKEGKQCAELYYRLAGKDPTGSDYKLSAISTGLDSPWCWYLSWVWSYHWSQRAITKVDLVLKALKQPGLSTAWFGCLVIGFCLSPAGDCVIFCCCTGARANVSCAVFAFPSSRTVQPSGLCWHSAAGKRLAKHQTLGQKLPLEEKREPDTTKTPL